MLWVSFKEGQERRTTVWVALAEVSWAMAPGSQDEGIDGVEDGRGKCIHIQLTGPEYDSKSMSHRGKVLLLSSGSRLLLCCWWTNSRGPTIQANGNQVTVIGQ